MKNSLLLVSILSLHSSCIFSSAQDIITRIKNASITTMPFVITIQFNDKQELTLAKGFLQMHVYQASDFCLAIRQSNFPFKQSELLFCIPESQYKAHIQDDQKPTRIMDYQGKRYTIIRAESLSDK